MKFHVNLLLKGFCFELFGDEKYGLFWAEKLMERCYLLITEEVLVLNFSEIGNKVFLSQKVDGEITK